MTIAVHGGADPIYVTTALNEADAVTALSQYGSTAIEYSRATTEDGFSFAVTGAMTSSQPTFNVLAYRVNMAFHLAEAYSYSVSGRFSGTGPGGSLSVAIQDSLAPFGQWSFLESDGALLRPFGSWDFALNGLADAQNHQNIGTMTGILAPGTYFLSMNTEMFSTFGAGNSTGDFAISFNKAAKVDDAGTTSVLLLSGLAAMALGCRRGDRR